MTPQRLIEARHGRGLTVEEVAKLVNVPYAVARNWETGASQPSKGELESLGLALNFPVGWFTQPPRGDLLPIRFSSLALHAPIKENDYCIADCGDLAEYLCDQRGDEGQYICSKPLCGQHAVLIKDEDFCPSHAGWHVEKPGDQK